LIIIFPYVIRITFLFEKYTYNYTLYTNNTERYLYPNYSYSSLIHVHSLNPLHKCVITPMLLQQHNRNNIFLLVTQILLRNYIIIYVWSIIYYVTGMDHVACKFTFEFCFIRYPHFSFISRIEFLKLHIPVACKFRVPSIAILILYVVNSAVCVLWRRIYFDTGLTGDYIVKCL
jgi:hypothetical protein